MAEIAEHALVIRRKLSPSEGSGIFLWRISKRPSSTRRLVLDVMPCDRGEEVEFVVCLADSILRCLSFCDIGDNVHGPGDLPRGIKNGIDRGQVITVIDSQLDTLTHMACVGCYIRTPLHGYGSPVQYLMAVPCRR